jgi:Amt family ammonium transporter
MADVKANYLPQYASYNWTGAPSDAEQLMTNELGGNSRMSCLYPVLV